jgi:hypothetical protein
VLTWLEAKTLALPAWLSAASSTRISMRRCRVELASLPLSKGRETRRSVGRQAVGGVTECAPDPGEGDA